MSLYQTLYFMSLVGGIAGLLSWALVTLVSALIVNQTLFALSDVISATLLGGFIGAFTVAFSDRWAGNRGVPRWIVSGALTLGVRAPAWLGSRARLYALLIVTVPLAVGLIRRATRALRVTISQALSACYSSLQTGLAGAWPPARRRA